MYRIRFHGRGGQGVKTASRMLGSALFYAGMEVQDAPRYGAERRGAPIFAYVRADHNVINERGVIVQPDLVLVADDSLPGVPAAGVTQGVTENTVLFIVSRESSQEWSRRLNTPAQVCCLPPPGQEEDPLHNRFLGAFCAGAAARLIGCLDFEALERGMQRELSGFGTELSKQNLYFARQAFDAMAPFESKVKEGLPFHLDNHSIHDWISLQAEDLAHTAPAIYDGITSVQVKTGLWRTIRPVIDYERCRKCNWVCSNYCPDNAIVVQEDGFPRIDLDHCKGCMICVAQCPPHAIETIVESVARAAEQVA